MRTAIPAPPRVTIEVDKGTILVTDLDAAGKKTPAQSGAKGKKKTEKDDVDELEANDLVEEDEIELQKDINADISLYIPIAKVLDEEMVVTGIVLEPDAVDGQKDTYKAPVVKKAAYNFLQGYGTKTTLGFMHKEMNPPFALCESYIAPTTFMLGTRTVKRGTWVMSIKVNDEKIWKMIKEGKITGLSVGGVAKVKMLKN